MLDNETASEAETKPEGQDGLSALLVLLLKGVLYKDNDARRWSSLLALQNRVRDYVKVLGLELILDEAEGYAFLRSRNKNLEGEEEEKSEAAIPRLIARR